MAEYIAKERLAAAGHSARVISMGTLGIMGSAADTKAILACRQIGLDLSGHRSQGLNTALLRACDWVFCMETKHLKAVRARGVAQDKAQLLGRYAQPLLSEIWDPVGHPIERFVANRDILVQCIERWIEEL